MSAHQEFPLLYPKSLGVITLLTVGIYLISSWFKKMLSEPVEGLHMLFLEPSLYSLRNTKSNGKLSDDWTVSM